MNISDDARMDTSHFSLNKDIINSAEPLNVNGATSVCFRVKLYGKMHFLKMLKPEFKNNPRYIAAIKKEFEIGYNLDHPHLVRYVACGDDYLLTEYIDGLTLNKFAECNPEFFKKKANVDRLLSELLDVLGYLHSHQIVHLDLKPDNILVTRVGNDLKLTDLGFCYTDTFIDTTGRTNNYAAPEQFSDTSNVDERTDIFAIGKIIATLPYANRYGRVVERCTKPRKEERYQSVAELRRDLGKRHTKWSLWAVIAVITCLVGITTWWAMSNRGKTLGEVEKPTALDTAATTVRHSTDTAMPVVVDDNRIRAITATPNPMPESPRIETHVTATAAVTSAAPANSPAPTKKEISHSTLRAEMMAIARPCYNRYLKPYESYSLSQIKDQYNKIINKCYDDFTPKLIDLWDTKYKQYTNLTQRQYYLEIGKIREEFDHTLFTKLQANDANASNTDDN